MSAIQENWLTIPVPLPGVKAALALAFNHLHENQQPTYLNLGSYATTPEATGKFPNHSRDVDPIRFVFPVGK